MSRRPCTECPWRKDVAPGQFPPERYEELAQTTGTPGNEAPLGAPMFACHKAPDGGEFVCAGWQAAVGLENLTARLAASRGGIDPEGFHPGPDWPELYASYVALLEVHGG
jgi:Family of unknown function (DUF6283)